jgi:predicted ATPase/DNA-binding SARP family transcriptional activator
VVSLARLRHDQDVGGTRAHAVEVLLLGPVAARVDGGDVLIGSVKQRVLLARVALSAPQVVSVDRLVEALWGESSPPNARGNIQSYVSRVRAALGEDVMVHANSGYRLGAARVDVHLAGEAAARARALRSTDPMAAIAAYDEALSWWRGPALVDLAGDLEFGADADRLDELRDTLGDERDESLLTTGQVVEAVESLRHRSAERPRRERTHVLLMRALHLEGRSDEALRVGTAFRRRLAEQTGLDPSAALREVEQMVLSGDAAAVSAASATTSPSATAVTLPRLGAFLGRDVELDALDRLTSASRLVTVTGPGGVGKTRLVAEWAHQRGDQSIAIVELAGVDGPGLPHAVAAAVGVNAVPGARELVDAVAGRELVLVLDNCEHVAADVRALVGQLTAIAPGVRVVATSRVRLGLPAEHILPLAPLPHGRDDDPAVSLLQTRIAALDQAFVAGPRERSQMRAVCRRLDGLPLALELAAGRAAAIGLDGLVVNLDRALDLLSAPTGARPDRHATLRRVVEWSLDQLDDRTAHVLASLSVFEAPFTLDAIEAVAGPAVASEVATLVDASLLATVDAAGRPRRFRMLELVRAAASERLDLDGHRSRCESAHAAWTATNAALAARRALGAEERDGLRDLEELRPELRSALQLCVAEAREDLAGELAAALARPVLYRPDGEALSWLLRLAEVPWAEPAIRVEVLGGAARAAYLQGDLDACSALAREAVEVADGAYAATAWHALGVHALYRGQHDAAERWWRLLNDHPAADPASRVDALGGIALVRSYAGDHRGSAAAMRDLLACVEVTGSATASAWARYVEAEALLAREPGAAAEAEAQLADAIDVARDVGAGFIVGVAGTALLASLERRSDPRVRPRAADLLEHWVSTGTWTQAWTTVRLVAAELADTTPSLAAAALDAAERDPAAPAVVGDEAARLRQLRSRLPKSSPVLPRAHVMAQVIEALRAT